MIKALLFDCFGVLTTDLWREFVASLPPSQQTPAVELNHIYDTGHLTRQEFLDEVYKLTGRPVDEIDAQVERDAYKNLPLLDYIKTLKTQFKIGLLSNVATGWIREDFLTLEEQSLFDDMVLSYEVGLAKPDQRMFELAAERLGLPPSGCLFIDDQARNCAAAQEVGMATITYDTLSQTKRELRAVLK